MELPEIYVANSSMQRRDTIELIVEFSNDLSNMKKGKCIDIGCGPGQVTRDILLTFLPEETETVGRCKWKIDKLHCKNWPRGVLRNILL